jgi:internalin A
MENYKRFKQKKTAFKDLPREVFWVMIFPFLGNSPHHFSLMCQISKVFYPGLNNIDNSWKKIIFSNLSKLKPRHIPILVKLKLSPFFKRIDLTKRHDDPIPKFGCFQYFNLEDFRDLTELKMSYNRIEKIERQTKLKKRWLNLTRTSFFNGGHEIEGLDTLTNLIELDLSKNFIKKIEGLNKLTNLRRLDLSTNVLFKIEGLDTLINLRKLNLSKNYTIAKLEGLNALINLRELDLSSCRFTKIEGLDTLTNLKELNLSNTSIKKIEGLNALTNLQKLNLSRTCIAKIEGLDALTNLQKLNLSKTLIAKIEGLDALINLRELDLSFNRDISKIEGLDKLTNLGKLDLTDYFHADKLINVEHMKRTKLKNVDLGDEQTISTEHLQTLINFVTKRKDLHRMVFTKF